MLDECDLVVALEVGEQAYLGVAATRTYLVMDQPNEGLFPCTIGNCSFATRTFRNGEAVAYNTFKGPCNGSLSQGGAVVRSLCRPR